MAKRKLHWWLLLVAPASDALQPATQVAALRVPNPKVDVPGVRARQILAWLFQRLPFRAAEEFRAFQQLHPKAEGTLAGKTGRYVDLLQKLLTTTRKELLAEEESDWPTFAGAPTRNRVLVRLSSPQLWQDGPTWSVPLVGAAPHLSRRPVVHPVIVDDQVLVASACAVRAYRLTDGAPLFQFDLSSVADKIGFEPALKKAAMCSGGCTLSVGPDAIFARLGAPLPWRLDKELDEPAQHQSFLVCLDRTPPEQPGQPEKRQRVRWQIRADGLPGLVGFAGALVHGSRVYVALNGLVGQRTRTQLLCLRADNGKELWRQEVCVTPEPEEDAPPFGRHHLLTLAGPNVVYCSHSGAVVAARRCERQAGLGFALSAAPFRGW